MCTLTKYRLVLSTFMLGLILSGITAFPLAWEMRLLTAWLRIDPALAPEHYSGVAFWVAQVDRGLQETYAAYPWMAYGTDWLAFAHIAITVYFVGPLMNPVKNEWVIYAGLVGCVLVIPLAVFCGAVRGIPLVWRLIDCSFGILGAAPLLYCLRLTAAVKTGAAEATRITQP